MLERGQKSKCSKIVGSISVIFFLEDSKQIGPGPIWSIYVAEKKRANVFRLKSYRHDGPLGAGVCILTMTYIVIGKAGTMGGPQ